jgi:hypothetical protein
MTRSQIAEFRRHPGPLPAGWAPIQASVVRHSDDQTITALAAVTRMIGQLDDGGHQRLDRWGLLTACRFVGRSNLVVALSRFRSEGVWGVSPHLIPHYALHSPAGTLSLALGIHGPNLGIGGGLFSGFEGLLTALTWLRAKVVPGVCLVICGWNPEFVPDSEGQPTGESECLALALALVPVSSQEPVRPRLRLVSNQVPAAPQALDLLRLDSLLVQPQAQPSLLQDGSGQLPSFHRSHEGSAIPRPHLFSKARQLPMALTLGHDASGGMRVELVPRRFIRTGRDDDGR